MFKKKVKAIKKPIDSFVEPKRKEEAKSPVLCECGKPVHETTNQCWACAHRA